MGFNNGAIYKKWFMSRKIPMIACAKINSNAKPLMRKIWGT